MAGHNKWANIKHRKGAQDKRKGILFSKCSKAIMAAVKQAGPDPDMNLALVYAIEKARESNMPRERIERAIHAAAGTGAVDSVEEVIYEGYGPGGVALMIESLTDNRHRTAPEMKKIFEKAGGNMGGSGCVSHLFVRKAIFTFSKDAVLEDRLVDLVLEAGGEDVALEGEQWLVTGAPERFTALRKALQAASLTPAGAGVSYLATMKVDVSDEDVAAKILKLVEVLDEHDDVSTVHANFDIPDPILERLSLED